MNIDGSTDIRLQSLNSSLLLVNGEGLKLAETTPDDLRKILTIGRHAILADIKTSYEYRKRMNPDLNVGHPPVTLLTLGYKKSALSAQGMTSNTNLHRSIGDLKPIFYPYWHAVVAADLPAQARTVGGYSMHTRLEFDIDQ